MTQEFNVLVVSDLHLSEGLDPSTGSTSRLEDFLRDDAFARFLRYHEQIKDQPRFGGRPWLLILNGDLFDFLQVVSLPPDGRALQAVTGERRRGDLTANERAFGLGTSAGESEWKLRRIARGHQSFFAALGSFVARGNSVAVVRGNHDVELHWERVQERFIVEAKRAYTRRRMTEGNGPPITLAACRERVSFHPWLYCQAGRVYVEHGCQYDALNHFRDFRNPVLPEDPEHIDLPLGSLFVRYLFNKLEDVHPFADNVKPLTRYLSWAFKTDPVRTVEVLLGRGWIFLRAFWKTSRKVTAAALHRPGRRPSARQVPDTLPPLVAQRIRALARYSVEGSWKAWLAALLQGMIGLLALLIIGTLIALLAMTLFLNSGPRWMAGVYALMAILAYFLRRGSGRSLSRLQGPPHLLGVARELAQILEPPVGVSYVVMGHDHRPTIERVDGGWYVNTGAWVTAYERDGPVEGRENLTFFRLGWGYQGTPELLRWDDAAGAPTRMVLWDHPEGGS